MKRKLFFRFFTVTLASTLLMFIFGFLAVRLNTQKVMTERLVEETKIVALLLNDRSEFDEFKVYEGNDKFRVTIIALDGEVLLESDTRDILENHKDRPEFQNALNDQPKTVKRYSETFGCEMIYYAMKVELDNEAVVLRLALRSSEMTPYLAVALPLLVLVLVFAIILSIVISRFISAGISSKITAVGDSLKSLNKGEYAPIKADGSEPEFYSVLCEINELNENTHAHILETERERTKLNKVLESISQGIIAVNSKCEIVFANKSVVSMFNSSANNKNLLDLIKDIDLYNKISSDIFESHSFEYKYGERDLSITIRALSDDDIKISSIIIITDISNERLVARQKSEFFANASHELKTPITVMQGLSELLLDEDLSDSAKKRIERIHKESLRLGSLISDMLKLSKLEKGEDVDTTPVNVNLGNIFLEVFDELSEKMAKKRISYTINGEANISVDPRKIYEVAENLSSNAVNYNKEGGKITVDLLENDSLVKISVSDTGIGIDKKHIPMLCQRFYRVDKSRSKKTGGTGLGLAIVKHICALYGGTLEIESELDVGSTFTVTFYKKNEK